MRNARQLHQARSQARTEGLYDPRLEHDACGVGFVADLKNQKTHKIIEDALKILVNLTHRGAVGADPLSGDGAGLLMQIPHEFFAAECARLGIELPERADVDEVARRGAEAGCLAWEPQQLPAPVGYVCALTDPDGNVVEFSHDQGVYAAVADRWGTGEDG